MAAAIVKSVYGHIFINPTSVGLGGVQLLGIDPSLPIRIMQPPGTRLERHGLERDAIRSVALISPEPPVLAIPAMGSDVDTLKLLFAANTSDGLAFRSDDNGTQVVKGAHASRTTALEIRPLDISEPYWYFPAVSIDAEAIPHMNVHRVVRELAESSLIVMLGRVANTDFPAIGKDTATNLNALYGL